MFTKARGLLCSWWLCRGHWAGPSEARVGDGGSTALGTVKSVELEEAHRESVCVGDVWLVKWCAGFV